MVASVPLNELGAVTVRVVPLKLSTVIAEGPVAVKDELANAEGEKTMLGALRSTALPPEIVRAAPSAMFMVPVAEIAAKVMIPAETPPNEPVPESVNALKARTVNAAPSAAMVVIAPLFVTPVTA